MIERQTYTPNFEEERKLVYNPSFDERGYRSFHQLTFSEQQRLKTYTRRQLETYIGERVSAIRSTTRFEIVEEKMVADGVNQSMEDMVRKGVEYRRKYGNRLDFDREDAELLGAVKPQAELTVKDSKVGAKRLSVSSRGEKGSDYTNNFFDVYELKEDENGKRYVELNRYLSTLTLEQYKEKLKPFTNCQSYERASDFLKEPINVDVFESSDDVQKYLNKDAVALDEEKLELINKINARLTVSYINSLIKNPYDFFTHRLKFNSVLNQTDETLSAIVNNDNEFIKKLEYWAAFAPDEQVERKAATMGMFTPRVAGGPCPGVSAGFNLASAENINNPYSVAQFGQKKTEQTTLCCKCPFCQRPVEAAIGGGRISCPECGKSAPYSKL